MKLHKQLTVNSEPLKLSDSGDARLSLFTPGRAVFTVQAGEPLAGVVIYSAAWNTPNKLAPWFIGFIETSTKVDDKQQRLFCRELTAVLHQPLPLALRGTTLADTLAAVGEKTGLQFKLPDSEHIYSKRRAAVFYNIASGYHAMDELAAVYDIPKLLWQQQVDGKVFVGSWNHSRWADKPVEVPRNLETKVTSANSASIPAILSLRPGAIYNGNILTAVDFIGSSMQLTWHQDPWAAR